MDADADMTSLDLTRYNVLKTLALEHCWYNVERNNRERAALVAWGPREVYWHMFSDVIGRDEEWLMRYHRDVRGPV